MPRFQQSIVIPGATAEALWRWHAAPGAFPRLAAPWARVKPTALSETLTDGTETRFTIGVGPVDVPWRARHRDCEPGRGFIDESVQGPFSSWVHHHGFEDCAEGAKLTDTIDYRLPLGGLGQMVAGGWIADDIRKTFAWRHARTSCDLIRHRGIAKRTIAVSGATGLVGRALCAFLTTGGHDVRRLVRRHPTGTDILWSPARGELDPEDLAGVDAVIHLAGETVAQRWTPDAMRRIRDSRVKGTDLLARAIAACSAPPSVFVSASAIGIYGHRDEPVDEDSETGTGFLADVAREWEAAAQPARRAGVRVVHPRIGIVQARQGGALQKQLPIFLMGAGGPLGSGSQGLSWVAIDDLVDILYAAVHDTRLVGPVNAVSPNPVTQRAYAKCLGSVLSRPAFAPAPEPVIRWIMGKMGEEMLLSGAMVRPSRLLQLDFSWRAPVLRDALRWELGRFPVDQPPPNPLLRQV